MTLTLPNTHHRLNGHREVVPPPSPASFRWETEVLVLRGDDRAELRQRVQALVDYLTRNPSIELKDLAFTLNTTLAQGGSRLAVVAESVADLQSRLGRAVERLDDSRCRHIKDSRGCYFFEQPLGPQGKLAVLFPGEGSQYLNMLADLLPHFPEAARPLRPLRSPVAAQRRGIGADQPAHLRAVVAHGRRACGG